MKWICPVHPHIVLFDDDDPAGPFKEPQYCSECDTYYFKRECDEMSVV
jgi:hypothetical protein